MRTFTLTRGHDESGVSGTGIVVEGVEFTDGHVVVRWLGEPCSTVIWNNFAEFWTIHVAAHPSNNSVINFGDGTRRYQDAESQRLWDEHVAIIERSRLQAGVQLLNDVGSEAGMAA